MLRSRRIPLAWRNLTEDPWRLAASAGGAAFAVVLMFSQVGFRNALLENMVAVIEHLDGQLFLINRTRYMLTTPAAFPRRRLEKVLGFDGVASASPLYVDVREATKWRNPASGLRRRIRVLAYSPAADLLDLPQIRAQREAWDRPEVALADIRSKADLYSKFEPGEVSELRGQRIRVAGTFDLGTDFRSNGTLLMSEANFLNYFPERRIGRGDDPIVDVGVIRVRPGTAEGPLIRAIRRELPADVVLLTKAEFKEKERTFWEAVAPIGVVFDIGVVMGFIVGTAICYQVLFSEISDRVAEFATLKAMGYSGRSLVRVIVEEGIYLAILGYAVGMVISLVLARYLERETGLNLDIRLGDSLIIFALTVIMCILSGLLAGRKLSTVDPAELFG
jgi:putative ABC transport system permease protein